MNAIRISIVVAQFAWYLTGPVPAVWAQSADPERTAEETRTITIGPAVPERGGVLLRRGSYEIAPEFRYALQSSNRIIISGLAVLPAVVIGTIEAAKVQRQIIEPSASFRYGLLDDLQLDTRVPFRYSNDRISRLQTSPTREDTVNDIAFGDIESNLSYQMLRERSAWPALVTSLGFRSITGKDPFEINSDELPSGTGFWGLRGAVSAVKVRDPVVLFGRLGYTMNFTKTVTLKPPVNAPGGRTKINPGDTVEWGAGFAYALSPEFSINNQFVQRITFKSEIDKIQNPVLSKGKIPGTHFNIPEIRLGAVWAYNKERFVDTSVSVGLSDDAPDVSFQFSLPFRFSR
jgi:hypothetical protein